MEDKIINKVEEHYRKSQENFTILINEELQKSKNMMDDAYELTLSKYGSKLANESMLDFYMNEGLNGITRDNNSRDNMFNILQVPYRVEQILLEYAISSFILNGMECDISNKDLTDYAKDSEGKLNYDNAHITKVVAVGCAVNPSWAYILITCNLKIKKSLLVSFLIERYGLNKKKELDNCPKAKFIKLTDKPSKPLLMSKDRLNNEIRLMAEALEDSIGTNSLFYPKR